MVSVLFRVLEWEVYEESWKSIYSLIGLVKIREATSALFICIVNCDEIRFEIFSFD